MERVDRLSVSEVTTLHASFESDVATYSAAGLGGIGVWESKIAGRDPNEVADVISAAGMRVSNLVPDGNSVFPNALYPEPADPGERTDALCAKLPAFAVLHPEYNCDRHRQRAGARLSRATSALCHRAAPSRGTGRRAWSDCGFRADAPVVRRRLQLHHQPSRRR